MSREIKFRALKDDHSDCSFVYGSLIYSTEGYPRIQINPNGYFNTCLKDTEGQYTGLKDKNEKEIYEGDWCRAEFRTKFGITVIQGQIIMDEYMWCIDCTGCVGDDIFSINRPHNFEIIGNIHENPELI